MFTRRAGTCCRLCSLNWRLPRAAPTAAPKPAPSAEPIDEPSLEPADKDKRRRALPAAFNTKHKEEGSSCDL